MKKFFTFFALLQLLILSAAGETELIRNGNFKELKENGTPANWSVQMWRKPEAVKCTMDKGRTEDAQSVVLESSDVDGYIVAAQSLELKANTTYVYTFYSRGENVKADKRYNGGSVLFIDDKGKVLSSYSDASQEAPNGTTEWRARRRTFKTGTDNLKLRVMLIMRGGTGKVWFSEFSLKELR